MNEIHEKQAAPEAFSSRTSLRSGSRDGSSTTPSADRGVSRRPLMTRRLAVALTAVLLAAASAGCAPSKRERSHERVVRKAVVAMLDMTLKTEAADAVLAALRANPPLARKMLRPPPSRSTHTPVQDVVAQRREARRQQLRRLDALDVLGLARWLNSRAARNALARLRRHPILVDLILSPPPPPQRTGPFGCDVNEATCRSWATLVDALLVVLPVGAAARFAGRTAGGKSLLSGAAKSRLPKTQAKGRASKPPGATPKKSYGACSFSGDTPVLMANGSRRSIRDVRVGDVVMASDPLTRTHSARAVTHLWVHTDQVIRVNIGGQWITTTEDHPFWNATDHAWQPTEQLDVGDAIGTADDRIARVRNIDMRRPRQTAAYNLTVDGAHTYHVGTRGLLVHNKNNKKPCKAEAQSDRRSAKKPGGPVPRYPLRITKARFGHIFRLHGPKSTAHKSKFAAGTNRAEIRDLIKATVKVKPTPNKKRPHTRWDYFRDFGPSVIGTDKGRPISGLLVVTTKSGKVITAHPSKHP